MIKKLINEDSAAASLLHPKSRPHDDFNDAVEQAIANYQRLNANQKARYIDYLQKVFHDSAWAKHGTGVKGKNIPFNKEEVELGSEGYPTRKHFQIVADTVRAIAEPVKRQQMANHHAQVFAKMNPRFDYSRFHAAAGTVYKGSKQEENISSWPSVAQFLIQETLEEQLDRIGFTEEAGTQATQLFYDAIEERLNDDPFRQALSELLNNYSPPSPFISDEDLDAVNILGDKIKELEAQIEYVERENEQLSDEIEQSSQGESFIPERVRKRSTIEEHLLEPDEANESALFNENHQHHNAQMRSYLNAMGQKEFE